MSDEIYNELKTEPMQSLMRMVVDHGFMPATQSDNLMKIRRLFSKHFREPEFEVCCGGVHVTDPLRRLREAYRQEEQRREAVTELNEWITG